MTHQRLSPKLAGAQDHSLSCGSGLLPLSLLRTPPRSYPHWDSALVGWWPQLLAEFLLFCSVSTALTWRKLPDLSWLRESPGALLCRCLPRGSLCETHPGLRALSPGPAPALGLLALCLLPGRHPHALSGCPPTGWPQLLFVQEHERCP